MKELSNALDRGYMVLAGCVLFVIFLAVLIGIVISILLSSNAEAFKVIATTTLPKTSLLKCPDGFYHPRTPAQICVADITNCPDAKEIGYGQRCCPSNSYYFKNWAYAPDLHYPYCIWSLEVRSKLK